MQNAYNLLTFVFLHCCYLANRLNLQLQKSYEIEVVGCWKQQKFLDHCVKQKKFLYLDHCAKQKFLDHLDHCAVIHFLGGQNCLNPGYQSFPNYLSRYKPMSYSLLLRLTVHAGGVGLKLVFKELQYFGNFAGIFPDFRGHINRFVVCTSIKRLFATKIINKAELLQVGIVFLIHLFAQEILLSKKLEIEKTKPTQYSTDVIKVGLVLSISNFFYY